MGMGTRWRYRLGHWVFTLKVISGLHACITFSQMICEVSTENDPYTSIILLGNDLIIFFWVNKAKNK